VTPLTINTKDVKMAVPRKVLCISSYWE